MPELPEVETVVRDLRPLIVGRSISAVRVGAQKLRRPWDPKWNRAVVGCTISAIRRRGKWIVVELDRDPRLLVHLGMTGQFTAVADSEPVADHTHLRFSLGDGELRFRDVRRFGSVELFPNAAAVDSFLDARLGPEPDATESVAFLAAISNSNRPLKAILLDQSVVAGVGNIYADEALHRAKLHPERRGKSVDESEAERLRLAIAEVIAHAITLRGSTIRDYVGGSGLRGGFQHEFRAYGRTGDPCETCRTPIAVIRVAGRSSHFCPQCQAR